MDRWRTLIVAASAVAALAVALGAQAGAKSPTSLQALMHVTAAEADPG
jgi:hypothetical protein